MDKYESRCDFQGNDNAGKPRLEYCRRVEEMTRKELKEEAKSKIWLSAFAANNSRSDFHWHVSAIYVACDKFPGLYEEAYNEVVEENR